MNRREWRRMIEDDQSIKEGTDWSGMKRKLGKWDKENKLRQGFFFAPRKQPGDEFYIFLEEIGWISRPINSELFMEYCAE